MFSRMLQWSAALMFGVILAGAPALASTIIAPGGVYTFNAAGAPYLTNDEPPIGSGGSCPACVPVPFTHDYTFNVPTNVGALLVASVQSPLGIPGLPRITNLVIGWLGGPSITVTDGLGNFTGFNTLSASLLGGFTYVLQVTGTSYDNGRYNFDMFVGSFSRDNEVTPTPLPPALILFGSALVGLGVLGRRRRQVAKI